MKRLALFACLAALAAADAAGAQPKPKAAGPSIAGQWAYETDVYANGCKMTGLMTIKPDAAGRHACVFESREQCPDISVVAQESCLAQRQGDVLTIKSAVHAVKPQVGYDPDDFDLKIESGSRMTGMMRSFHSAPVIFRRGDAPIS
ncbi:MAG: hypothetical protein AB7M12_10010 [Hyphomonadaceae bacterium]